MASPSPSSTLLEPTIALDAETRATTLTVDLGALARNYAAIRAHVGGAKVMPILKANAYGHGLVPVAQHLEKLGAPYFGLAYLEEGIRVRQEGVRTPILVLGGILGRQIPRFLEYDLTLTASSVDKLRAIEECAAALGKRAKVHLKIDTGMERIGVHWYSAEALLETSLRCPNVEVEGIYSHLANSDAADLDHARLQRERFEEVLAFYERRSLPTPMRHLANSGAVLQMTEANYDMVRPGILLYGAYPSPDCPPTIQVEPALRWTSQVVYFKVVKAGNSVSYGSTWTAARPTRVVTVPVGYGDGYQRAMSGSAEVLVGGRRFPVVGRICMDQLMVDIGDGTAYNGDEVVLIGESGSEKLRIEDLAAWADTVPHEVLTSINTRVPRFYVDSGAAESGAAESGAAESGS
jgi:alanine racemase